RYLKAHRLVERCARMGILLAEKLGALRALPAVGDVRGKGLLAGIEFVADKATKAPFPRALRFAETFTACALEVGLVVWPGVGQAGGEGDLVMLAPPFIISPAEIEEISALFGQALLLTLEACHVRP
ncbi:MAG TPA: aminotransferase class III-fold pyridoxal phosphate-dependent enzyme, partial [Anaeromyxobacteraceae bacterium]|nr:aminotransferase class III-fold pyridoxal phosphate-dependent enzyme [Anaeromyxobacteraceae bacterium]